MTELTDLFEALAKAPPPPDSTVTLDGKPIEDTGLHIYVQLNGHPEARSSEFHLSPLEVADIAEECEREEPDTEVTVRIRSKFSGAVEVVSPAEFRARFGREGE